MNTDTVNRYCRDLPITVIARNVFGMHLYQLRQDIRWCWKGPIVDYGQTTLVTGMASKPTWFYRGSEAFQDRNGNEYTGIAIGTFEWCPYICIKQKQIIIKQTGKLLGVYEYAYGG